MVVDLGCGYVPVYVCMYVSMWCLLRLQVGVQLTTLVTVRVVSRLPLTCLCCPLRWEQLCNVLSAYVFYRPDIGYVQGTSQIVASLLLVMTDKSEAAVFTTFANFVARQPQRAFLTNDFDTVRVTNRGPVSFVVVSGLRGLAPLGLTALGRSVGCFVMVVVVMMMREGDRCGGCVLLRQCASDA